MRARIEEKTVKLAAVASAAPKVSQKGKQIRAQLLTSAGLSEMARQKLLDQGFALQVMDDASLLHPSTADLGADIVIIDGSLLGLSNPKGNGPTRRGFIRHRTKACRSFHGLR